MDEVLGLHGIAGGLPKDTRIGRNQTKNPIDPDLETGTHARIARQMAVLTNSGRARLDCSAKQRKDVKSDAPLGLCWLRELTPMRPAQSEEDFRTRIGRRIKAAIAALLLCIPTVALGDEPDARDSIRYVAEFARSKPFTLASLFIPNWEVALKINGSEFRLDIGAGEDLKDLCIIEETVPTTGRFIAEDLMCDGTLDELKVVQLGKSVPRSLNITANQQSRFEADAVFLARSIAALSLASPAGAEIENFEFPDPFSIATRPDKDLAAVLTADIPLLKKQGTVEEGKYHFFWVEIDEGYRFQRIASTKEKNGRPLSCLDMIITPELNALGYHRIQFEAPNCQLDGSGFYRVTLNNKFEPFELSVDERANWINGFSRVLHYWNVRENSK
ncbi:hypothetical protein [Roseovarius nanhaiticus]|uniref:hypothetical protein n=1 Tax=Roseovarius nanhaiticus TaxID=573024 RepID=UPI002490BB60|nr:hypothetical protein [Roseovarius nanhaiticus]